MLAVCLLKQIKPSSSLLRDAVLLRFRSYRSGKIQNGATADI
jgi:hypothetical protein